MVKQVQTVRGGVYFDDLRNCRSPLESCRLHCRSDQRTSCALNEAWEVDPFRIVVVMISVKAMRGEVDDQTLAWPRWLTGEYTRQMRDWDSSEL